MRSSLVLVALLTAPSAMAADLIGQWSFEPGAELVDSTGHWGDIELIGNASISGGALDINGTGTSVTGWARSRVYDGGTITSKTLVSWVELDSLGAYAGSPMGLDDIAIDKFDSIVYGESVSQRWMAGSTSLQRYQDLGSAANDSQTGVVHQMAISYEDLGGNSVRVTACRDGVQLGQYTVANNLASWSGNSAEVLFGPRHTLQGSPESTRGALDAHIEEARLYDGAMTCAQVGALALDSDGDGVPDSTDACNTDPNKSNPEFCGCEWLDLDLDQFSGAETCVHMTAYVHPRATLQPGATVDAGAVVGSHAVVGPQGIVGQDAVVGRGAVVEGTLGTDVVVGRNAQVLNGTTLGASSAVGYGSSFDLNDIGANTVVGALVSLGYMTNVGSGAVLARDVQVGGSVEIADGVVIGPDGNVGDSVNILTSARIRKLVTLGASAYIGSGTRLGREVEVGSLAQIGNDVVVRAEATVSAGTCLTDNATVDRGATAGGVCP